MPVPEAGLARDPALEFAHGDPGLAGRDIVHDRSNLGKSRHQPLRQRHQGVRLLEGRHEVDHPAAGGGRVAQHDKAPEPLVAAQPVDGPAGASDAVPDLRQDPVAQRRLQQARLSVDDLVEGPRHVQPEREGSVFSRVGHFDGSSQRRSVQVNSILLRYSKTDGDGMVA